MNFSRISTSLMVSFIAFAASAFAADPALPVQQLPEEDIPVEVIPALKTMFSFGMRRLNSGPTVRFGNLGAIPQNFRTSSDGSRIYSNGSVSMDGYYSTEVDANGVRITSPDTNPTTNAAKSKTSVNGTTVTVYNDVTTSNGTTYTNVITSRFRAYEENRLRNWNYMDQSQVTLNGGTGSVAMSTYGSQSSGGSITAESKTGSGVDFQLAYTLGKLGKHFEWGVTGGIALSDFNAKTSGIVKAILLKTTDTYTFADPVNGVYPEGSQPGSTTPPLVDPADNTTVLKDAEGNDLTGTDQRGGIGLKKDGVDADRDLGGETSYIDGNWQLKGAYYAIRMGPSIRYRFNDKFAFSASAGLALAYVGSTFRASETLLRADTLSYVKIEEENSTQKLIGGCFAELNAEYWLTERSGFYLGYGVQKYNEYRQKSLRGRTARMDIGSSTTFRFGIMTRF